MAKIKTIKNDNIDIQSFGIQDTISNKIPYINIDLLNKISKVMNTGHKYSYDLNDFNILKSDLIISIFNLYSNTLGEKIKNHNEVITKISEYVLYELGLSIYSGLDKEKTLLKLSEILGYRVFKIKTFSEEYNYIIKNNIPYEISIGINDKIYKGLKDGLLLEDTKKIEVIKSFTGCGEDSKGNFNIYDSFGKTLEDNNIVLKKDNIDMKNFSSIIYIILPNKLIDKDLNDLLKLNNGLDEESLSAMRRGFWDGINKDEIITKETFYKYILRLKQKHKI